MALLGPVDLEGQPTVNLALTLAGGAKETWYLDAQTFLEVAIDSEVIDALYAASAKGVKISLIIRGICCLRPGIPGVSETIRVRSVVGRFLEHSRVYHFENDGAPETWCSSADWMERNLFRRNESCFEIRQKAIREQIRSHLELFLADNCQAWVLQGDGSYERLSPAKGVERISAQETFLEQLTTPL